MYICEICKRAPLQGKFRRRWQWKTQKGFDGHRCYKQELEWKQAQDEKNVRAEQLWQQWLSLDLCSRKVGQFVYTVLRRTVRPMYEQRGSRMVKVRYEEEYAYYPHRGEISTIIPGHYLDAEWLEKAIRDKSSFPYRYLVDHQEVYCKLFDVDDADAWPKVVEYARLLNEQHQAALKFAEMVR